MADGICNGSRCGGEDSTKAVVAALPGGNGVASVPAAGSGAVGGSGVASSGRLATP